MGRVLIDMGRRFRGHGLTAAALLLLAGALYAATPARATDAEREEGSHPAAAKDKGHEAGESESTEEAKDSLDHVMDSQYLELFESFGRHKVRLYFFEYQLFGMTYYFPTKFMWLELLAAVLVAAFYIPMAWRLRTGELPAGWNTHAREVLLTFMRDEVAVPAIGHDADRFVPFIWTMFLFILFNNLLGMIPFCGSPTGNIYVTAGLALCVFFAIHGSGIAKMGAWHYVTSMWPDMDVPYGMGYVLKPLIFGLEWLGVLVRNGVLAVRLFANMFSGHVVLATILIFIFTAQHLHWGLWGTISVLSVLGQVALSLLELFVAFLQAYIFTFLAAIFMGLAMHPAH